MEKIKLWLLRKCVKFIGGRKADSAPSVNGVITHSDVPYADDGLLYHKLDVYFPAKNADKLPAVIYVHGGGWCVSDKKHFRHFCRTIAAEGYVVFNVNYRLAPEYRHPAQLLDILSAMEWVKANAYNWGADPAEIFMSGDSAGAYLASLAACICTKGRLEEYYKIHAPLTGGSIRGCVLFCGTYDLESCLKTSFPFINDYVRALLGEKNTARYRDIDKLSVIKNITPMYPPCLISDSTSDALINESRNLIEALDANHVKHTDLLLDDVGDASAHEYQIEYDKPVFDLCKNEIIAFLRDCGARS